MSTTVVVTLNIAKLSAEQKVTFATHVQSSMTGNANFTSPFPALSVLGTAITAANTAIAAQVPGNKSSTKNVKDKVYQLVRVLKAMAAYVEFTSNDNATIALTSGFSVKGHTTPAKGDITARHGVNSGEMDLVAKAIRGASYIWQYTSTPAVPSSWVTAAITKQSKHSITGLTPATNYSFRVALVTKSGQQPFSNAVVLLAL
jgi:fibronectin type III domain protein